MKAKLLLVLLLGVAAAGGWILGRQSSLRPDGEKGTAEQKVLFYQSPMHPWIKSDKPGNCTICGMKLVAVHEGEQALEGGANTAVRLSETTINVLNVETAAVERQPLHRTLRVAGTIDDDDTRRRRLSAYVDGRIEYLGVRYVGAEVKEGELLAKLYSPALLAARDEYLLFSRQTTSAHRDRLLSAARERLVRLGLTRKQIEELPFQIGRAHV